MPRHGSALSRRLEEFRIQSEYWRSLSNRALFKLLLAVFFMFSTTGLVAHIQTIASTGRSHWLMAFALALFAGASAAAFVFAFIRDKRYLLLILLAQAASFWLLSSDVAGRLQRPLDPEQAASQVALYGSLCTLTLMVGYLFFIDFIVREGVRHMGLRAEMALAERTHRFLVPPLDLRTDRLEAYGESRPSSQVGGDLLDATELDGGTLLYVADVSGHGVAAGTLMSLTKGALRSRVLAGVPLSTLVGDLNRVLLDLSSPNMFVTLAALRFGQPGAVEACLAGHLPILHFRAGDGAAQHLSNQNLPLGLLPDVVFETRTVTYGPGDVFAILTDGLTEVESAAGDELGVEDVQALLARSLDRPLPELHATVMEGVKAHGPQLDDQTLLLIRAR
jgi:hypothetical protein